MTLIGVTVLVRDVVPRSCAFPPMSYGQSCIPLVISCREKSNLWTAGGISNI